MAIYKIRNIGKLGVITDLPAYDTPIEAWVDASNVRFVANRVEKIGGYTPSMVPTKDGSVPMAFCQEPETSSILYATQYNIYRYDGTVPEAISNDKPIVPPATTPYDVKVSKPWDYTTLSNCVVFNDPGGIPQGWLAGQAAGVNQKMIDIPGWGVPVVGGPTVTWHCDRMKAYKNYLIALNMSEPSGKDSISGGLIKYPQRIRWSDVADVNALPPNWHQDDPNTDGGFVDLADCTGNIIDGRPLRDYFLIYTDRETYIMRFVGGDFVFDIQKLFPDAGILNSNCVCEFEGGYHFVISQDDIFTHDGSSRQSIVTDIIKEKLLGEITSVNYQGAKVFAYPTRKEIWVCYPSQAAQEGSDKNYACDRAAIWNWKTGAWSFTDLPGILWMNEVTSPDNDQRAWLFPDRSGNKPILPISDIKLDSPIYSLGIGDNFRMDVIYKQREGLMGNEYLTWTSSDSSIADFGIFNGDGSVTYRSQSDIDGSSNLFAKATGTVTITVKYHRAGVGGPDIDLTDSYDITITAQGTPPGDRHMADDPNAQSDPNEPIPDRGVVNPGDTPIAPVGPYRPNQKDFAPDPDNQWESTPANQHDNEQWEKKGYSFASRAFIGCSQDTNFYFMDTGLRQIRADNTGVITSNMPVIAEMSKYGISMSDIEDGLYRHKTFRTIYPLISGEGTLRFNIGGSNDAYVMPIVNETKQFVIGQDYKVDCFTNYRYMSYTIRDENEGKWSFSGMDIDYFLGGNR